MKKSKIYKLSDKEIIQHLKSGKLGVIPTDTIYGVSCVADNKIAVDNAYTVLKRDTNKPFIMLISNLEQLNNLMVEIPKEFNTDEFWPGPYSIIFQCNSKEMNYLHRGTNSIAVRMPKFPELLNIIEQTGPIISTSANPQGLKPANNIQEAFEYFGKDMDFYVDDGELSGKASTVMKIDQNGKVEIIRA